MTQEEVAILWKDANGWDVKGYETTLKDLERFAKLVAAKEREACVKECKKLLAVFLSSKYSTGQPLSSFKERHAVAACIESIEARGQA